MTEDQIRLDIRAQLLQVLCRDSEARLVEEMEICAGKARADMAVISDQLIGIEIKGPQDSLSRLPGQVDQYSKCFDQVVLVVHEHLAKEAIQIVPRWWGVVVGENRNGINQYRLKRQPTQNRRVDLAEILALLWRQELEALFVQFFKFAPPLRASKRHLREQLLAATSHPALKIAGIRSLRHRREWRSEAIARRN